MEVVEAGDILVFVDGKSTAELSHGVLTRMLNGGGSGKSGSGSDGGHKLVLLKGRYSRQIGIVDDGGRRKIGDYVERATGGRRRRGEGGRAGTPKSAVGIELSYWLHDSP